MDLSIDLGASTIDVIKWHESDYEVYKTLEYATTFEVGDLEQFLLEHHLYIGDFDNVFLTGGRSRFYKKQNPKIQVVKEIDAIGFGGAFLLKKMVGNVADVSDVLVVSMGTGTCLVHVKDAKCVHLGGTGVGGGTFLGLNRQLFGIEDIEEIKALYKKGHKGNVDLTVGEIVGGDIGVVSANVTASNLGKIARNVQFTKEDLAAGIVNLVGQTIATAACFAAKSVNCSTIVLAGKLTRMEGIVDVIYRAADVYNLQVVLPDGGEYVSAIGAGAKL